MIREMTFDKNELSLHHQAKGLVYTMMDHEHHENANLPVNLNLLTYNDKALTRKLTQSLFTAPYTHSASPEFKSNIILFSIFQISFLVVSIIVTSLEYAANQKSRKVFMLKITLLAVLSCCTFLALTAMAKSSKFLLKSREVLSWLSIAMVIYMSICDERVLSGMIGQDFSSSGQYTITIIGLYIAAVRHALMDSFKNLAILSGVALASALATTLAFSAVPLTSGLSDFFILLAFLVIVLMDTYQNDLRIKQLFWRKEKEKEYSAGTEDLEHEDNLLNNIKTEIEIIIQSFDKIKKNLKNVCAVIMYKDVKNKLKLAINEIDRVKRRLAHGTFTNVFKLEHHPGISENDKLFIVENFADPNHTALKRCSKIKQSRLTESPLWSNQGTEIEVLLGGIGNMWNFDIWFVYQTTGYSVYLAAKYMMKKWLLAETLNIEYSVSENYFLTLEKVKKI